MFAIGEKVVIRSEVRAFPEPIFHWVINGKRPIPNTFWTTAYEQENAASTLNYNVSLSDVTSNCTVFVLCQAKNSYGTSEHNFDVYLSNSDDKNCFSPPILLNNSTESDSKPGSETNQLILLIIIATVGNVPLICVFVAMIGLLFYKRR